VSFEGKGQRKHTIHALWWIRQPALTRSDDLRKDHVLRQGNKNWACEFLLAMSGLQAPDPTVVRSLPQFWLSTPRFLPALAVGTHSTRIPCFRSSSFSPRPPRKRSLSLCSSSSPFAAVHCELLPVTSSSLRPLRNLRVLCDLGLSSTSSHLKENLKPQGIIEKT
jgi:hypothetical protein